MPRWPDRESRTSVVAMVLAGGSGERLRPLTLRRCKPAVHFGGGFRVVDFTLMNCISSAVFEVRVLTQYLAESLEEHCRRRWGFVAGKGGVSAHPPPAGETYLGTADAVLKNLGSPGRGSSLQAVLVLSGDHVYHADYRKLLAFHREREADITVLTGSASPQAASSFGVLQEAPDGRITRFVEKPRDPHALAREGSCAINLGVYCFRAALLWRQLEEDSRDPLSRHDFGRDVIPRAIVEGARVFTCPIERVARRPYWRDVGTLQSFFEASMDLVSDRPPFRLVGDHWPRSIPFRSWTPREVARRLGRGSWARVARSILGPGAAAARSALERCVLGDGAQVGPGARLKECVVLPGARVEAGARLRRVIVEEGVCVPEGTEVEGEDDCPPIVWVGAQGARAGGATPPCGSPLRAVPRLPPSQRSLAAGGSP